jgi:uncharacterized protein YydD (DUF2326 family)
MLKRISSNDARFKSIDFGPGLNLIVADKTKSSSKKDTRNGLGKTTLIEILHFCLGAEYAKLKTLKAPELKSWIFTLELEVAGKSLAVIRSLEVPQTVLLQGDIDGLPIGVPSSDHDESLIMACSQWTVLLGHLYFDLPLSEPVSSPKYRPSFRGLVSYFMRRSPGSYLDAFIHYAQQKEVDKQVCNTFLLGLNYEYAKEFQQVKDKDADIKTRKKQAEQGILPGTQGRLGELEARKVPLQEQIRREQEQLSNFQVNPQYSKIEKEAAELTKKLHEISENNINDARLREFYADSLREETYVEGKGLLNMYTQLGLDLPLLVHKRFEEVQEFHQQLLSNRRKFLAEEITRLDNSIVDNDKEKDKVAAQRAKLMNVLKTQGALEEYTKLQENLNDLSATLKAIERQIQVIAQVEKDRSKLQIEKELLLQKAQTDFEERLTVRERAISLFNENSQALYKTPGELIIELGKTGYTFDIEIERSPSEGVGHMKVLSYDLTVQQLCRERGKGPDFLFHDSTIFDGVDERQCTSAITLLHSQTVKRKFQYILAMNTDKIPYNELGSQLNVDEFIKCRLTDKGEDGGILGFRLKSTEKTASEPANEKDEEVIEDTSD